MANVIFKVGTREKYDTLITKDSNTLYFLYDVLELYRGSELYGTGKTATDKVAGLMSPEDKAKLDNLIAAGVKNITILNGGIQIEDGEDGGIAIGLKLSSLEGNALRIEADGLFSPVVSAPVVPEFELEKVNAVSGFSATYRLKRIYGAEVSYVGDEINIPKDMMLQSGQLQTVVIADQPYSGAQIGDPYLDLVLNTDSENHVYIPVKGLVDVYVPGAGIAITDGTVSLKLDEENANGLVINENGLALKFASKDNAGAMSAVDKQALDSLPYMYEKRAYEVVGAPYRAVVDYRDKEIRVMCAADTEWTLHSVGANGDPNKYYIGVRAYAPSDEVVSFKEDLAETINDQTMYTFDGEFAGVDQYGRKYSVVWLPVASYDASTDSWSYYGANSGARFIGWYYSVEWYNASGDKIASDRIRINLSNESCHAKIEPYYMYNYAPSSDVAELRYSITAIEQSCTWGAM